MTAVVGCVRVEDAKAMLPGFPACERSTTYKEVSCPACQQAMWLGAKSERLVQAGHALAFCMPCVIKSDGGLRRHVVQLTGKR